MHRRSHPTVQSTLVQEVLDVYAATVVMWWAVPGSVMSWVKSGLSQSAPTPAAPKDDSQIQAS